METTYRLVDLDDPKNVGQTAASHELALLCPGQLWREKDTRLGV